MKLQTLQNGKTSFAMSGKLIDTNVLIYLSKKEIEFEKVFSPSDELFMSVITYMEVLGYRFTNNEEKHFIESLCKHIPYIELDSEIVEKVIQIKQRHKIKLPDAIILATAIIGGLDLVTVNVKDFIDIAPNLSILNPLT